MRSKKDLDSEDNKRNIKNKNKTLRNLKKTPWYLLRDRTMVPSAANLLISLRIFNGTSCTVLAGI